MLVFNKTVAQFLNKAAGYTQSEFEATFPLPFLLVKRSRLNSSAIFATLDAKDISRAGQMSSQAKIDLDAGQDILFSIEKSDRNVFAAMVTVGRATNNDIIINHPSVSKMHAYFNFNSERHLTITDFGSKNGTFVDSLRLQVKEPKVIESGIVVRFGKVETMYLDPTALYAYLDEVRSVRSIMGT